MNWMNTVGKYFATFIWASPFGFFLVGFYMALMSGNDWIIAFAAIAACGTMLQVIIFYLICDRRHFKLVKVE